MPEGRRYHVERGKGEKIWTTVIAQSVKYALKNELHFSPLKKPLQDKRKLENYRNRSICRGRIFSHSHCAN